MLWHYTNYTGMKGILENKQIWATDAHFLNDSMELHETVNEIDKILSRMATSTDSEIQSKLCMIKFATGSQHPDVYVPKKGPYIASFCENGDLLSQWRGYAHEGGFALGFNTDCLDKCAEQVYGNLYQVRYLKHGILANEDIASHGKDRKLLLIAGRLARYKHAAFHEEKEWRIIIEHKDEAVGGKSPFVRHKIPDVLLRDGAFGRTPYMAIPINFPAQITIGPGPNQDLTRRALEIELENLQTKSGKNPPSVSCSRIPYRW